MFGLDQDRAACGADDLGNTGVLEEPAPELKLGLRRGEERCLLGCRERRQPATARAARRRADRRRRPIGHRGSGRPAGTDHQADRDPGRGQASELARRRISGRGADFELDVGPAFPVLDDEVRRVAGNERPGPLEVAGVAQGYSESTWAGA